MRSFAWACLMSGYQLYPDFCNGGFSELPSAAWTPPFSFQYLMGAAAVTFFSPVNLALSWSVLRALRVGRQNNFGDRVKG